MGDHTFPFMIFCGVIIVADLYNNMYKLMIQIDYKIASSTPTITK